MVGDLGSNQQIYGVRLTTDGPGNNLKRYQFSVSDDGQEYTEVYVSHTLVDEVVTHLRQFQSPISGRYVRLQIDRGIGTEIILRFESLRFSRTATGCFLPLTTR